MFNTKILGVGAVFAVLTASCASTPEPEPEPLLSFEGQSCTDKIDLANAIMLPGVDTKDGAKKLKRMMKNRTIILSDNFDEMSSCMRLASGGMSPYAIFQVPTDITGQVIYAGSKIDANSMFAADISLLDQHGEVLRKFDADDFKRIGSRHAVQFTPKQDEAYVLIKADTDLMGKATNTMETSVTEQTLTVAYGAIASSGTNLVGTQKEYNRRFSYDGEVGIRIVFPEQDVEK